MKKIPTIWLRDEDDRAHVTREVHPDCEWVLSGLGVATRKWDGTCMRFDGYRWWARREVKPGVAWPAGFEVAHIDGVTHKAVGWIPADDSPFAKYWLQALDNSWDELVGTYELVGPKVNGNAEKLDGHYLIRHGITVVPAPKRDYDSLRALLQASPEMEGLVFWRAPGDPDSQLAKIKRKDFA